MGMNIVYYHPTIVQYTCVRSSIHYISTEWIYLIIQALKKFIEGDAILILDPRLERSAATNLAVEKILELSLSCVASNRHNRPTMRKCAEILWTIRKDHREHAVSYPHSLPSNVSAGAD